jgi:hypothetical protein
MDDEAKKTQPELDADEGVVSRAELAIAREKVQIERERLALERERSMAERERWKTDHALRLRAEGRGIALSTLIYVGIICMLTGGIVGALVGGRHREALARNTLANLQSLNVSTNTDAKGNAQVVLRPVDAAGGRGAYLLILN